MEILMKDFSIVRGDEDRIVEIAAYYRLCDDTGLVTDWRYISWIVLNEEWVIKQKNINKDLEILVKRALHNLENFEECKIEIVLAGDWIFN